LGKPAWGPTGYRTVAEYTLYYWQMPFRGQFVRAILAHAGKSWDEPDDEAVAKAMGKPAAKQPIPFMGPPLLIDHATGFALSEMPAIVGYLGETLWLTPDDPQVRALTTKITCDANDVIDEMTRQGGMKMWTKEAWAEFRPRLKRWMSFWEVTGERHGLEADRGFILGGDAATTADIVTATVWFTLAERFPRIGTMLKRAAPKTEALARRMMATPALAALWDQTNARFGEAYCGGKIETSLRKVAG
jgi:glutathione S-transferase